MKLTFRWDNGLRGMNLIPGLWRLILDIDGAIEYKMDVSFNGINYLIEPYFYKQINGIGLQGGMGGAYSIDSLKINSMMVVEKLAFVRVIKKEFFQGL
jgi:hypothetical protein